jgi:hypothetical protein
MLELDITAFIAETCPRDYSASCAELGENAGAVTWHHACEDSNEWNFLDTDDKREDFRAFVGESGGWNAEEIAAWSDVELNALCIQWIAADIRDCLGDSQDWHRYGELLESGSVSGSIYRSDDGAVYWSVS